MEVFTSDRYIPPMTDSTEQDDVQCDPAVDPLEVRDDLEVPQVDARRPSSRTQAHSQNVQQNQSFEKSDGTRSAMADEEENTLHSNTAEAPTATDSNSQSDSIATPKNIVDVPSTDDYSSPRSGINTNSCASPIDQTLHKIDEVSRTSPKLSLTPDSDHLQPSQNDHLPQTYLHNDEDNIGSDSSQDSSHPNNSPSTQQFHQEKRDISIEPDAQTLISNSLSALASDSLSSNNNNNISNQISLGVSSQHVPSIGLQQHPVTPSSSMSSSMMPSASSTPIPGINNEINDYCNDNLRPSGTTNILHNIDHIQENGHGSSELQNSQSRPNSVYDFDSTSNSEMSMVNMNNSMMLASQQHHLQQQPPHQSHSLQHNPQQLRQMQMNEQHTSKEVFGLNSLDRCDSFAPKRDILSHLGSMNHMQSHSLDQGNSMSAMSGNDSLNQSYDSSLSVSSSEFPNTASCYDPVLLRRARGRPRGTKNGAGMGRSRNSFGGRGSYKFGVPDDRTCTAYDLRHIPDPFGTARRGRPRSRFIVDLGEQNHEAWTKARIDLNVSDAELTTLLLSL